MLFAAQILAAPFATHSHQVALQIRQLECTDCIPAGRVSLESNQQHSSLMIPSLAQQPTEIRIPEADLPWVMNVQAKYANTSKRYAVRRSTGGYSYAVPTALVFVTSSRFHLERYEGLGTPSNGRLRMEVTYTFLDFVREWDDKTAHREAPALRDFRGNLMYRSRHLRFDVVDLENSQYSDFAKVLFPRSFSNPIGEWDFLAVDFGKQSTSHGFAVEGQLLPLSFKGYSDQKVLVDGRYQKLPHVRVSFDDYTEFEVAIDGLRFVTEESEWDEARRRLKRLREPNNRGHRRTTRDLIQYHRREEKTRWTVKKLFSNCWKWFGENYLGSTQKFSPSQFED